MPVVEAADAVAELPPQVGHLLAAARAAIDKVPYCWVATPAQEGGAHARVVKAFPNDHGEEWWTRWFLTKRTARKTAEILAAGRVTLAFQHNSGNAYVSLSGPAELIETRDAVESRLQQVDDPNGYLAGQLIALRVEADLIELHIRGVTGEPWGHGRTSLGRSRDGVWRLLPS
jgi:general stress protein 26